jgi:hypothetical protein
MGHLLWRLAAGLERLMLTSSQEINVDKDELEILQFIQVLVYCTVYITPSKYHYFQHLAFSVPND